MAPSSKLIYFFLFSSVTGLSFTFNFTESNQSHECTPNQNTQCIKYQSDAFFSKGIQITKDQLGASITFSVGRAIYAEKVLLWDSKTGEMTDFTTRFTFQINSFNESVYGDGLAFFLSPDPSIIPFSSAGGFLGLVNTTTKSINVSANSIVAVEFDSFKNDWDPSDDHVGINVNSIQSVESIKWNSSIKNGRPANAWISYNASSMNLSVFLTYEKYPVFDGNSILSCKVDLRKFLPENVVVGFSAATGNAVEIHTILYWEFSSSLERKEKKSNTVLSTELTIGFVGLVILFGMLWFVLWRRRWWRRDEEEDMDVSMDDEFEKLRGPKRFTYNELATATRNFREEGKLGEGGFGGVYKGFLEEENLEVAIKKVSKGSSQGKKEYISEVKIISKLRHRNLVQLVGWCHSKGDFLLVYEFMPNGSLDTHLYKNTTLLAWQERYKIALGLASALLYLHEEWEQCVVHRDIKPSNVMLDSEFNAKLGDFGLARLVDHDGGPQTTIVAGTRGYMAPEYITSGKASKKSDVYSFGIVTLEISCGRRPVELREEPGKVRLVEFVWDLYGRGMILDAVDERLENEFDEDQIVRLIVVGLWCAHPDYNLRPSMKQAIGVLNFEAPLPILPPKMPVLMYFAPPLDLSHIAHTSTSSSSSFHGTFHTHGR
ncbi:Non-specific serine/threonine protein kinase protein [Dioscorea alata]|uniref:Non-specific serine/threonine protein kinase protein n=1 Tax=Dioscorea alata TaxID=55571 RepID=A0ACB7UNJ0_DIOAL|nr:Non-specific serine/threonine protein kinase protein [Dioscorea alata]